MLIDVPLESRTLTGHIMQMFEMNACVASIVFLIVAERIFYVLVESGFQQ